MKSTKWRRFFRLLGVVALVLVVGVMLTGCDLSTVTVGGGLVLGGIIGAQVDHVFIGIIIGGIIGFIVFLIVAKSSGSSSNSSIGSAMDTWIESRKNDPHTCSNCSKYSSLRGDCRHDGAPKSAGDSCMNWR